METEGATRLPFLEWGVAARPMPGETESGDQYVVQSLPTGALLAVIDGLGHGAAAAVAARSAVATLRDHAQEPLDALVRRCHERLRQTNGVVLSVACFQAADQTLAWLGVGNVECLLIRGDSTARPAREFLLTRGGCLLIRGDSTARPAREFLLTRGGVVGYQLPTLRASSLAIAAGDTLLFATDGIRHAFLEGLNLSDPPQQMADAVLSRHAKDNDDALVLVARFVGLTPATATEARHGLQ
jgi:negative regulator of sigma-B (phosphoserine phosphatase)